MPTVPAVSSGEILDVVVAPSSSRGESGSGGDRFAEMLAGASQGLGPEHAPAAPPASRGKEPQAEAAAPKGKGAENPPRESASAPGEPKVATSQGPADKPAAPEAEEGEGTPASSESEEDALPPGQENAAEVISQLIAAGVPGLFRLTEGAPVEAGGENGLRLGAASAPGQGMQEQIQSNALGLALADTALSQDEGADAEAMAQTAERPVQPTGTALAGSAFTQETEETGAASGQPAPAESEEMTAPPQVASIEGEAPAALEEGESQAPPLPDDRPAEEPAPVRAEEPDFPEASPEEAAEEPAARPVAAQEAAEPEEAGRTDWTRLGDAEGADAPDTLLQAAAPAASRPGEGDFGQPSEGDAPDGQLLAERQAVQAPGGDGKAEPPAVQATARDPFMRTEVHRQVLEAALSRMSVAVREGMAQARIQLDPPSLGRLHMDLRMQDGAMNAKVTVETAWAKDAVMSGLRELRESLQRQGVSLENFSVDVRANLSPGSFGQDRAGNQGEGSFYFDGAPEDEDGARPQDRGPVFASPSLSGDVSINIFA